MSVTVEQFVKSLVEFELMTERQLQSVLDASGVDLGSATSEELAKVFYAQGALTKYQVLSAFHGRADRLVLGSYLIVDELGEGGLGRVFKARHRRMDRLAAVKVLRSFALRSEEAVRRFHREVQAVAQLDHPNIVRAHDAAEADGKLFLVMEYVDGKDLYSLVREKGRLPVADAVDCIVQAAEGLAYAHGVGIVHRDIKPSNLILDKSGVVKILDMGLARFGDAAAIDGGQATLTRTGQVVGTIDYMSPEQAMDASRVDHRADIYSLGCTLYYLLVGEHMYPNRSLVQKILAHRETDVPSLRDERGDVPRQLHAVFEQMVAKQPESRHQSMAQVIEELKACPVQSDDTDSSFLSIVLDDAIGAGSPDLFRASDPGDETTGLPAAEVTEGAVPDVGPVDSEPNPFIRLPVLASVGGGMALALIILVAYLLRSSDEPVPMRPVGPPGPVAEKPTERPAEPPKEPDDKKPEAGPNQPDAGDENADTKSEQPGRDGEQETKQPPKKDSDGQDSQDEPVAPSPPVRVEVGYVRPSDQHFLVGLDSNSGAWHRLPDRTKLAADDQLQVQPTYRPEIVLTPSVQVVFAGPSFVRPLPPSEQGEPGLFVDFGRAFIATAGVAGARIHLDLGGHRGMATFVDAASEMAIEVRRYLPPGAHPEQETAQIVIRIFTTAGRIEWQDAGTPAAVPIDAGQVRITIADSSRTIAAGELPAWMLGEDLQDVDRSASTTLVGFLTPDRPITLSLTERIEDRRSEVRSLASRCLAFLGTYEPLVKEFSDSRQRPYWAPEFGVLRHVISHAPENAVRLRETFEGSCGDDAVDLYRMVWGYSPEQLREGSDAKLVDFLDHESLQVRVFAYENLRRITNETHIYFPESTEALRRSSVRKWREQLEDGAIIYDSLPTPLSGFTMAREEVGKFFSYLERDQGKAAEETGGLQPPLATAPFDEETAKMHQQVWAEHSGMPVEYTNSIGMELCLIPPGKFMMGSPESDEHAVGDERPQHRVRIAAPFYLGATEVTQAQWQAVMGTRPWRGKEHVREGFKYPAVYVNWVDACVFCERLSKEEDETYRLPTEAEWEYACRAGTTTRYHFSDDALRLADYAWFYDNACGVDEKYAHHVGQKKSNPFGLHDMHGNVWEWCADYEDYSEESLTADRSGATTSSIRVKRGGSWDFSPRGCRSAARNSRPPGAQCNCLGFRVALVPVNAPRR